MTNITRIDQTTISSGVQNLSDTDPILQLNELPLAIGIPNIRRQALRTNQMQTTPFQTPQKTSRSYTVLAGASTTSQLSSVPTPVKGSSVKKTPAKFHTTPLTYATPLPQPTTIYSPTHVEFASSPNQVEGDPQFAEDLHYFLSGISPIEANHRASAVLTELCDPLKNHSDPTALARKTLALIIRGEVADFVEVFHMTEPSEIMKTVELFTQVLPEAEKALETNPQHLQALVIKTGCLGLSGQYQQMMSTYNPPSPSHIDAAVEASFDEVAQSQLLYLSEVHQATLDSAEALLDREAEAPHLTGIFMKIQALAYQNKKEEAVKTLARAMEIYPDHPILLTLEARLCQEDDPKRSQDAVSRALALNTTHFLPWAILLQLLGDAGDKAGLQAAALQAGECISHTHPLIHQILESYLPVQEGL